MGEPSQQSPHTPPAQVTGLLPPVEAIHHSVIRVRGLKEAREPVQVSTALTLLLGIQVIVTQLDITTGHKYISIPKDKFTEIFTGVEMATRRYYNREHDWTLELESKQASGDPFHLPLLSPNAAAQRSNNKQKPAKAVKKSKKPKTESRTHLAVGGPPTTLTPLSPHPPPPPRALGVSN